MRFLIVNICMISISLNACASAGVTSPYFRPEPGVEYRYGNFCGDGHPAGQQQLSRQDRIIALTSIKPLDSIDRMCQLHDLCYAATVNDNIFCDRAIAESLGGFGWDRFRGESSLETQCENLELEIDAAFSAMLKRNRENIDPGAERRTAFLVNSLALGVAPAYAAGAMLGGFPPEGACHMHDAVYQHRLTQALPHFVDALAYEASFENCEEHDFEECFRAARRVLENSMEIDDIFSADFLISQIPASR